MAELYESRRVNRKSFTPEKREIIVRVCELFISGVDIKDIAIILAISMPRVCESLSIFYFPYRGDNKITITLKSKV